MSSVKAIRKLLHLVLLLPLCLTAGCLSSCGSGDRFRPPRDVRSREYVLETTGYCPCGECCGWHRNWLLRPVYSSGPNRGKRKKVGYTASGTKARKGTIAADTSIFPFGTIMYIPGYGYGRVEDRGSAIKGYRIDLFYPHHAQAVRWGRVRKKVQVWKPRR